MNDFTLAIEFDDLGDYADPYGDDLLAPYADDLDAHYDAIEMDAAAADY